MNLSSLEDNTELIVCREDQIQKLLIYFASKRYKDFKNISYPLNINNFFINIDPLYIYHGCFPKNADGTHRIIRKGDKFITPTNKCFWKQVSDVENRVKTRNYTRLEPTVNYKTVHDYHTQKRFISQWILNSGQLIWRKSNEQFNFFVSNYVFNVLYLYIYIYYAFLKL